MTAIIAPRVALRLGRVSNLPTVWSNVLAGTALAGGEITAAVVPVLIAMSLMYVGGMFLNDAYDAEVDGRERPSRPIPSGQVSADAVFRAGFAMLALAAILLFLVGWRAGLAGLVLAGAIVFYDWHHKGNRLSPVVMGLCRTLVYIGAGYAAVTAPGGLVFAGALVLLCYLIGLTYVAKQESLNEIRSLWPLAFLGVPFVYLLPSLWHGLLPALLFLALAGWVLYALSWLRPGPTRIVPKAVISLIAGISLLDALFIAGQGASGAALLAIVCFAFTLLAQRWISGT
jgi:4-hydroxybenzoate polyprenyltransferase